MVLVVGIFIQQQLFGWGGREEASRRPSPSLPTDASLPEEPRLGDFALRCSLGGLQRGLGVREPRGASRAGQGARLQDGGRGAAWLCAACCTGGCQQSTLAGREAEGRWGWHCGAGADGGMQVRTASAGGSCASGRHCQSLQDVVWEPRCSQLCLDCTVRYKVLGAHPREGLRARAPLGDLRRAPRGIGACSTKW